MSDPNQKRRSSLRTLLAPGVGAIMAIASGMTPQRVLDSAMAKQLKIAGVKLMATDADRAAIAAAEAKRARRAEKLRRHLASGGIASV